MDIPKRTTPPFVTESFAPLLQADGSGYFMSNYRSRGRSSAAVAGLGRQHFSGPFAEP